MRLNPLDFDSGSSADAVGALGKAGCPGTCGGCNHAMSTSTHKGIEKAAPSVKVAVRRKFRAFQSVIGVLLLLSSATGIYLLATDGSLWLLALSHAVGLVIIVVLDFALGLYSLAYPKSAYLPTISAALLGFVLQLGDIFTAPQYNMTIAYFARYLFGLGAFDLLLGFQLTIIIVGVAARPHAQYLARRRTRQGRELEYSRRGFLKSLLGFAGLIGLGVVIGSIKLPAPANPTQTTTQTGTAQGSIANVNNLQIASPVLFEYPAGTGYLNAALIKNADGSLTAISTLCTHVCCVCSFDSAQKVFYCPCHGSVFDISGRVINGPATIDLPAIQLRTDGSGNVFPTGVANPGPCQA